MISSYQYFVSHEHQDEDWDNFLAQTPGGHHVQSTLWAQVKATVGWKPIRIVVKQQDRIVGGAQISLRRVLPRFVVGIVSKGPVLFSPDPLLASYMIETSMTVAREHEVCCLIVQPPNNGETLTGVMRESGFRSSRLEVAPTATIQIDLRQELGDILAAMKKQARRDLRHGLNCGLRAREGTEDDVGAFWRLLKATSERHNWPIYCQDYYETIMRIYGRRGLAKLFFIEYEGKAISSQILIAFGDTVIAKNSGWSGELRSLAPNNVLEWASIQWAKAQGYHHYDLEGICPNMAMAGGDDVLGGRKEHWCSYKFKYGGKVKLFPKAHITLINPVGNWIYKNFLHPLEQQPLAAKLIDLIRVH